MTQGLAFLIWLLCVGISAVLLGFFIKQSLLPEKREGFAMYTCPSGTNSFVSDEGETLCCNGEVVDGYCTGNLRCTLSPKSRTGLPVCSALAESEAAATGANKCPSSMPNYFGSCKTIEGCSASQPTANGLNPSNPGAPQCILYKTREEDIVKLDSCYNVVENAKKATKCAAAEATSRLPACVSAAERAAAPAAGSSSCPAPVVCPPPPSPPPQLPTSYVPKQNTLLLQSYMMPEDYQLDFDITPTAGPAGDWRNIIHFSSNGTDYQGGFGSRSPAIWFFPGTFDLHVRFGDSTDLNYGFDRQAGCSLNTTSHVTLRCKGKQVTLVVDTNVYKMTQPTKRYSGPVSVYGSNPWYAAAPCNVASLTIQKL